MNHSQKHQPRKRFGQHFLQDKQVIQQIVDAVAAEPTDVIVEIGAGLGALTQPLLQRHGKLTVIEFDRDIIPRLEASCMHFGELKIYEADALTFDFRIIFNEQAEARKLKIIGNLPYNISTPLLFYLLDQHEIIQEMVFMLQKEVVDRMASPPGSASYGRLSVMMQYRCQVNALFTVAPSAFNPPPQVQSAMVQLIPYVSPPHLARNFTLFAEVVRTAFNQRRKTLRNNLKNLISEAQLQTIGIDPGLRPQQLTVADFVNISNALTY